MLELKLERYFSMISNSINFTFPLQMSFFKQFYGSLTKSDYRALRAGFIMVNEEKVVFYCFLFSPFLDFTNIALILSRIISEALLHTS